MNSPTKASTRKRQRGFTLIELMVVVTIIGILAAIGIPKLSKFIRTAETAEPVDFASKIARGIAGYVSQHPQVTNATLTDSSNGFGKYKMSCPTGNTLCDAGKVSMLIPTVEQPAGMKWKFTLATMMDDTTGQVESCIMAEKLKSDGSAVDANFGPLYFSSMVSASTIWEGSVFRAQYLDKTATFAKGGACAAATPTAQLTDTTS